MSDASQAFLLPWQHTKWRLLRRSKRERSQFAKFQQHLLYVTESNRVSRICLKFPVVLFTSTETVSLSLKSILELAHILLVTVLMWPNFMIICFTRCHRNFSPYLSPPVYFRPWRPFLFDLRAIADAQGPFPGSLH